MGVVGEFGKFIGMGEQWREEDLASKRRETELRLDSTVSRYAALDAGARGALAAGLARQQGTKLGAKQRVAFSNSGVDATVGTAADVIAETAMLTELDANTIRNNAAREAWGHKRTADKQTQEADFARDEPQRKMVGRIFATIGQSANVVGSAVKTFG